MRHLPGYSPRNADHQRVLAPFLQRLYFTGKGEFFFLLHFHARNRKRLLFVLVDGKKILGYFSRSLIDRLID